MFDFKPSAALVRTYLSLVESNLSSLGVALPSVFVELGGNIDTFRERWAGRFRAVMVSEAHRVRYGICGDNPEEFVFLVDGEFPPKLAEHLADSLYIPPSREGDALIGELAEEFLRWAREHERTVVFGPRAPIESYSVEGKNVLAHLRPYVPEPSDPDWIQATVVE